jgi:chromosome partitioning protein
MAVNLAWYFAEKAQLRVLIADLDPQFNTTQYLLFERAYHEHVYLNHQPTMWHIFEDGVNTPNGIVRISDPYTVILNLQVFRDGGRLDLIPSQLELSLSLRSPHNKERNLPNLISEVEHNYDLILIDCAPTDSVLTTAAYLTSDYVLIPVQRDHFANIGVALIAASISEFKHYNRNHPLQVAGIFYNNSRPTYGLKDVMIDILPTAQKYGWHVFETEIPYSESISTGVIEHLPFWRAPHAQPDRFTTFAKFAQSFAEKIGL